MTCLWVNEVRGPTTETILEIRDGLQAINPVVAAEFINLISEPGG